MPDAKIIEPGLMMPGAHDMEVLVAADAGDERRIKALVEKGIDVAKARDGATGSNALHLAAAAGHVSLLRFLLTCTPLEKAIEARDNEGRTALHAACSTVERAALKLLIEKGADVTASDKEDVSPLLIACSVGGASDAVSMLLEADADVHAASSGGVTPLAGAVLASDAESVQMLLARGARVAGLQLSHHMTLLHMAAAASPSEAGALPVLKLLLPRFKEADLGNTLNPRRLAPLHCAAEAGTSTAAGLLLLGGAPPSPLDRDGRTPLDVALGLNRAEVAEVLRAMGGETADEIKLREAAAAGAKAAAEAAANTRRAIARRRVGAGARAAAAWVLMAWAWVRRVLAAAAVYAAAWASWAGRLAASPFGYRALVEASEGKEGKAARKERRAERAARRVQETGCMAREAADYAEEEEEDVSSDEEDGCATFDTAALAKTAHMAKSQEHVVRSMARGLEQAGEKLLGSLSTSSVAELQDTLARIRAATPAQPRPGQQDGGLPEAAHQAATAEGGALIELVEEPGVRSTPSYTRWEQLHREWAAELDDGEVGALLQRPSFAAALDKRAKWLQARAEGREEDATSDAEGSAALTDARLERGARMLAALQQAHTEVEQIGLAAMPGMEEGWDRLKSKKRAEKAAYKAKLASDEPMW